LFSAAKPSRDLRTNWLWLFISNWILPSVGQQGHNVWLIASPQSKVRPSRRRVMGEIPSRPLFSAKLRFVVAVFALAALSSYAQQVTSTRTENNPPQQTATPERKTLPLDQMPAEKRADILMVRGDYSAAIVAYQQSDLKSAIVWNNIGMAYHHLFALDQARKAYQQALAINPRFAAASNNLAAVYYGQHSYKDAEHWYKRALRHTSESAIIYCNLGTVYFAEDQPKKAIKMYRKAFSIDQQVFDPDRATSIEGPGSREQRVAINYYIAETFASAGNKEQAIVYLRKAMDEGFRDRKRLIEDKDFAVLRTTPEFQKLLDQENLN
jgi:Tfp pilus assembly protein PilF